MALNCNMEEKHSKSRRVCAGLFVLYAAGMLWLLLFQRQPSNLEYWEFVNTSYNLSPFQTLRQMARLLHHETFATFAMVNLVGNVLLFVPLGMLPIFWKPQRKFWIFFLTVTALILAVETLQLFTTLGAADIDDLIFNVLGACMGFGIWKLLASRLKTE